MSSKIKNGLLVFAIAVALLLCYKLAFSNTLSLRKEYKTLLAEELSHENIPDQLSLNLKKRVYYDSVLNKMNLGNSSIENNLLRIINLEAEKNKLKLIDFNEPHTSSKDNSELNTFDLTLEGDFIGLLRMVYEIEQKNSFGEIIHLQFQKNKDYRTYKSYLTARIFIQNIE